MKTLGVTGGIGSGKSTVCRLLEALGARVFFADTEARRLMEADPAVRSEVTTVFGAESYDADGHLNRPFLATRVFGDDANMACINAIVHPRVYTAFETAKREALADGVALMVKEAALIFETGGEQFLDAVLVVDAPDSERVRRVTRRDGITPDEVRARMVHQLPPDELCRRADFVIKNDGLLENLRDQVARVYSAVITAPT